MVTTSRDTVLFVVLANGLGGSTRSVATVLSRLDHGVHAALVAPASGKFVTAAKERATISAHVSIQARHRGRLHRASRLTAALRVARWARTNRSRLAAIHANGPEELNVAALAARVAGVPLVVWSHARSVSPWMRRLAPAMRALLRRHPVRWAAVSRLAGDVLVDGGLAPAGAVVIVPNPIDPVDVLAPVRAPADGLSIGYLGSDAPYKGFQFLPDVIERVSTGPVRWLVFSDERSAESKETWTRLRSMGSVSIVGKVADVREAYARCDVVFCPSLEESFCRVAAEAMLNGIPVVASDLAPVRELLGDEECGLIFPAGDVPAAAAAVSRLVGDPELRHSLGERGRVAASRFDPERVVERLCALYGLGNASASGNA